MNMVDPVKTLPTSVQLFLRPNSTYLYKYCFYLGGKAYKDGLDIKDNPFVQYFTIPDSHYTRRNAWYTSYSAWNKGWSQTRSFYKNNI